MRSSQVRKLRLPVVAPERRKALQKSLLGQVLGLGLTADYPENSHIYAVLVAIHQLAKTRPVTGDDGFHRSDVRRKVLPHFCLPLRETVPEDTAGPEKSPWAEARLPVGFCQPATKVETDPGACSRGARIGGQVDRPVFGHQNGGLYVEGAQGHLA